MGLSSSDILLVERGGACYKETFGNRANIDSSDLLLVERAGALYKCTYSDWNGAGGGGGGGGTNTLTLNGGSNVSFDINAQQSSSSSDATTAYDILEAEFSGSTTTGKLYIGVRMRGTTTYYHDFCLGAVQIVQSSGSSFRTGGSFTSGYDWNFHNTSTYGTQYWQTTTSFSNSYTADPSGLAYTSIFSSASNARWCRATGTGSSHTGAADGMYSVSQYSGGGGSILPASGTVSQTSSSYYIYTETSGSGYTIGTSTFWLRSPGMTVQSGDKLRIAYLAVGGNSSTNGLGRYDSDTLYFRFK